MNIKKIAVALIIVLAVMLAFIDLDNTGNEIKSAKPIEKNIEKEPGFGAVFAVIGLLTAKYIITRYKEKK